MDEVFKQITHYHFVGIGGIGMGALAWLLRDTGHVVTGSDVKENAVTQKLRQKGAQVFIGHAANHVGNAQCVVVSAAVAVDNPEVVYAQSQNIPVIKRAEMLAQLMEGHFGITIAGAHGKTTTSSMVTHLLISAGLKPTAAVGGILNNVDSNAQMGEGTYFVAEADESDGSFLLFSPTISVITNIDLEHVDYYGGWDAIVDTYRAFIGKTEPQGLLVVCGDDPRLPQLAQESGRKTLLYGVSDGCQLRAEAIVEEGFSSRCVCVMDGLPIGELHVPLPGRHNVVNALACVAVGRALSINFTTIALAIKSFQGVRRRFQVRSRANDIMIVDDYAHHPTEIKATIAAARGLKRKRLIVAFQPHRYSRLNALMDDFAHSLADTEYTVITDVYAASESPIEGVTGQALAQRLIAIYHGQAAYVPKGDVAYRLASVVSPGDVVLMLGAGDMPQITDALLAQVNASAPSDT